VYYAQLLHGHRKGDHCPEALQEHVAVCIAEPHRLMRTNKQPDYIFSLVITSTIDKFVGSAFETGEVYIPKKLQESVFFAYYVLLSEHFNACSDEGLPSLRRTLACMRSTLYSETHKLYLVDIRARRETGAHPPASRYSVNPYMLGTYE